MWSKTAFLIFITGILLSFNLHADKFLSQVEKKYQTAKSVQMQFQKKLKIALLDKEKTSEGVISIKKGGYFKWLLQKPEKQEIYLTPKNVWIVDYPSDPSDKIQILKLKKPQKNQSPAVVSFLIGKGELSKNFKITHKIEKQDQITYILKAKSKHEIVQNMQIHINKKDGLILGLDYNDPLGNQTNLSFSGIVFDLPIEKKDFGFKPPKNSTVTSID